jgi:arginyl-tRNA synthetase
VPYCPRRESHPTSLQRGTVPAPGLEDLLYLEILASVRRRFSQAVEEAYGAKCEQPALGFPPNVDLGEISITSCFELAKQLRQPPRKIAESVAARLLPIDGVERVSVAGAGYLNLHLDRAALAAAVFNARAAEAEGAETLRAEGANAGGKVSVEHTSINPNKAAHVGHLRNAVLGDTFARLLRFAGHEVEVQNYIDNTGVQVADVLVGFVHLEGKSVTEVRALIASPAVRFDYYCWDLYARVTQAYERDATLAARRAETLKAIEEAQGELAEMAAAVSAAIVRLHLETARRLNIRYDLLVEESEILRLNFWNYAFDLLKQRGALRFEPFGKNKGCWVMSIVAGGAEDDPRLDENDAASAAGDDGGDREVKIVVRSNGTVTYVGKDIAYHLWKFGLLGQDFGYEPFYTYPDGHRLWRTALASSGEQVPAFGCASAAYAVIDTRQSYLQRLVAAAFHELGYHEQAEHLHHFAYEVVNLSLAAAESLGISVGDPPAHEQRGYVEVSGRRGLGVKADDLIDTVIEKALAEVAGRQMSADQVEQNEHARKIGVAALRYFMLKFTRRSTIVFDFKDALAFEGETGPYLQYSVVRARNIFRKSDAGGKITHSLAELRGEASQQTLGMFFAGDGGRDLWELALLAAQLEATVEQAVAAEEPAVLAKYSFRLAQTFNNFYHHHRVLAEPDTERRTCLLYLVWLVSETLARALDLLGIELPAHM